MLVFLKYFIMFIIAATTIVSILILISKLKIDINNFNVQNINNEKNNKNFFIVVSFVILNLAWLKIKINKKLMAKEYVKEKLKVEEKNIKMGKEAETVIKIFLDNKKIRDEFKKISIALEKMDLNINVGLEDCVITSYLVGIIAIIISNICMEAMIRRVLTMILIISSSKMETIITM